MSGTASVVSPLDALLDLHQFTKLKRKSDPNIQSNALVFIVNPSFGGCSLGMH